MQYLEACANWVICSAYVFWGGWGCGRPCDWYMSNMRRPAKNTMMGGKDGVAVVFSLAARGGAAEMGQQEAGMRRAGREGWCTKTCGRRGGG